MSDVKLGQIQFSADNPPSRDAVHVAIKLAVAGATLKSGDKVTMKNGVAITSKVNPIGIVDPFIGGHVYKGQSFYIFLFPNTVTGMRHHWEHPFFDNEEKLNDKQDLAKQWIEDFCETWALNYHDLINQATSTADYRYVVADGVDLHSRDELGEDYYTFWEMLAVLTGKHFDNSHKEGLIWSCSC